MGRKCSRCGYIGHNSRTCSMGTTINGSGMFKLFGVQLQLDLASSSSSSSVNSMKKSFSVDCLSSSLSSSSSSSLCSSRVSMDDNVSDKASIGYLSDSLICPVQERKKGVPWTEEEHRSFLIGLERLGKGDWRGISRNFVTTRTPTQVASHAQKYFLRLASLNSKKRRSSLFDMVGSSNISRNRASTSDSRTNNLYATEFGTTPPLVRPDNSPKQGIDKQRVEEIRHPHLSSANILTPFLPNMLNETLPRSSPTPSNPISPNSLAPDELQLTLAAPISLDRNKPPSPTTPVLTIPY